MSTKQEMGVTHTDVMEALVTALMFGEDAGFAASAAGQAKTPETIYPRADSVVHVSNVASYLLAEAQIRILDAREQEQPQRGMVNHYYLHGNGDEAVEIDMSEVTPGNTEEVYTDQPVPEREA